MADWYVSSVAYAAVAPWAAGHTYAVGDIVRQLAAPTLGNARCFRASSITTGVSGGSEPAWNKNAGNTTTDTGVTWTEITGNSAHQHDNGVSNSWTAPARDVEDIDGFSGTSHQANGDRVLLSSDHVTSEATSDLFGFPFASAGRGIIGTPNLYISVNRAGSVPPAQSDYLAGATIEATSNHNIGPAGSWLMRGIHLKANGSITFSGTVGDAQKMVDCVLELTGASGIIQFDGPAFIEFVNTSLKFANSGSGFAPGHTRSSRFVWRDTANALQGAALSANLDVSGDGCAEALFSGLDLSNLTGSFLSAGSGSSGRFGCRYVFRGCILNTFDVVDTPTQGKLTIVEVIACSDSVKARRDERYTQFGTLKNDTSTYRTGGYSVAGAPQSHKLVSSVNCSKWAGQCDSFPFMIWNDATGSPKTLTVELISSGSLNTNDIWLDVEYQADMGDQLNSVVTSYPGELAANAAITTSTASWNNPPSTPVKQKLSVTFTPQSKGFIKGLVRLGKPSATVWIDPPLALS